MRQALPLDIPAGFVRNGTELETQGRWRDGSLVRWREGVMQPVGGWSERVDASATIANPPRAAVAWMDNSGDRWTAWGTSAGLYVVSESNAVTDITPAGFTAGEDDATINTGYGGGFYGAGDYGTERPDDGFYTAATVWSLDTWGENLVGVSDADQVIYEWALDTSADAVAVSGAPTACGLVVSEERFLFALCAGGDNRKVAWSDREDNTTWTPAATNEAGDFTLTGGTKIQLGIRVRGQVLILTDQTAHVASYIGPPLVYGFEQVGTACGAISRKAAAVSEAGAFWMGRGGFFTYAGGSVQAVPSDVRDFVFNDLNRSQQSKVHAVANAEFGEIWWFYPGDDSTECNRYVAYNYREGHWLIGAIDRTAGVDVGPFLNPIWASSGGVIYSHETGANWGGAAVYAETGPVNFGNNFASVVEMFPDEKTQGQVTATFKVRDYPNAAEASFGPYTMSNPVSLRFTSRQIRMRVDGAASSLWTVGINTLRYVVRGTR